MKFCSACGSAVSHIVPDGDNRLRFVCNQCQLIHYQNPRIITGCLPVYVADKQTEATVLLCKRAIQPRKGWWTLPAGFLENGETTAAGAIRETQEEANANIKIQNLYSLYSLPHISQVYMFFRAQLLDLNFSPGIESLEVKLFKESEIPWDELAFPVISATLKYYFADRKLDTYPTRYEEIIRPSS
ncbi:MAG: NUDIX hydrolase [Pseudomonadales bacterium]|nr:NUDIX hydrolase [Pseudomonadales bacterium]